MQDFALLQAQDKKIIKSLAQNILSTGGYEGRV